MTSSKVLSLLLFCLAFCSFLQIAAAQQRDTCRLKLIFSSAYPNNWGYKEGEGNFTTPLTTWYWATATQTVNSTNLFTSFRIIDYAACHHCIMTVFSTSNFAGKTKLYDFRTQPGGNSTQVASAFPVKSYNVKCFPQVEEDIDRSSEFPDIEWRQLTEEDNSMTGLRTKAVNKAVAKLKAKGTLPEGQYTITETFPTEFSVNYETLYRFNVEVTNDAGVRFRISATVLTTSPVNLLNYEFISYAYLENRLGDFPNPSWSQMIEDENMPLPGELVELRSRAVNQAVYRLKAKGVIPQGHYLFTRTFASEFSTSYDILYRFNIQITNIASGVRYRIQAAVFTSYDDLETFELIGYAYIERRLAEFGNEFEWEFMNEDPATLPLPQDITELRSKAVAQAVDRMKTKRILSQGTYRVTQNFSTEFAGGFEHPEFSQTGDFLLYRFNVQITNEAGVRFRIQAVTANSYYTLPCYELIDFEYIENRLGEFEAPIAWGIMYENEDFPLPKDTAKLRTRVVNHAIERLIVKGALNEGKYRVSKTFPTEFATGLEHPEFPLAGDYILYRFHVQITDESGVRYRISAISASQSFALSSYELIDFAYIENRLGEFSNTIFRGINEEELRGKAVNQAIDRLKAKGALAKGQYVVTKTLQTEFSAGYEHPEFPLEDGDVLWKFNVVVESGSATSGVKIFAIAVTNFAAPLEYELVDYGKV